VHHPEGIVQTIQSRIPGMTQNVPPVLDVFGRPVQRPASALGGANPFPVTTANADPVATELARLGIATPTPPKNIKARGQTLQLAPDESLRVAHDEGQLFAQRLATIMQSQTWKRLNDDQRRKALADVRAEISKSRAARVMKMRDERLSAAEGLGRSDVTGRSLQ
jgi:hypothetical protein